MKELVSVCANCGKKLYCLDGFFNGVNTDEQETLCFECANKKLEDHSFTTRLLGRK